MVSVPVMKMISGNAVSDTFPRISENWNFLNFLKTMIVWTLWFRLGLLSIRILCFLKSDKNDGVMAPKAGRENARSE